MRKLIRICTLVMGLLLLTGCGGNHDRIAAQLCVADSLMDGHADSALHLLDSLGAEREAWPKRLRMRHALLTMKAQNKAYVDFTTDSLALVVTDYYDHHGTANEQMMAHYLLGCVYRDLGEAPKALESYLIAVSKADTLSSDCDNRVLRGLYGQMAELYHAQNLPQDELESRWRYINSCRKLKDTIGYIRGIGQLVKPYYLLGREDSVLKITEETYKLYNQHGFHQRAVGTLVPAIFLYTEQGNIQKARQYLKLFEKESGLFDSDGNIEKGRESYYYTKGYFFQKIGMIDSAEFYYRRLLPYGHFSDAFRGLLSVYRIKHNTDSVAKYSLLYEDGVDSLHEQMQTEVIHQMTKLYDYNRNQKIAAQKEKEAQNYKFVSILAFLFLVGLIVYILLVRKRKKEEARRLRGMLVSTIAEKESVSSELRKLKAQDLEGLIAEKEKKEKELLHTIMELERKSIKPNESDCLQRFMESQIVSLFVKKSENRAERLVPSRAEWKLLVSQFSKDMPVMYETFLNGKLSSLELHICILLVSGFSGQVINKLVESTPQTVTNAKSRANKKLFNVASAASLNTHLKHLIRF